ncbi:hypothetical protein PVAND_002546 [Polypedilum vanderplanki]|uniref:Uncharacterized protein n=1 Tax=Polypedilum vanderplanki TaxID=319348 RepID=A0A9J6BRI3_POLVA|nr:hypothetical protein PVAND_002546 [Polypedilum vanderplanki]
MKNKLLNFTICQALIVIGMSLLCVKCQEQKLSVTENVTVYDRSFHKVLSRRRRFLLWRPGSNVLLTASLVKPLAFRRPTGHNLIIEWDIFYPLPSSWRVPKKPKPKPPPPPPTTTELPIEPVESWTSPKEVWQPDGGWTNDVIAQINADNQKNAADRRIWQSPLNKQISDKQSNGIIKSQSFAPVSLKLNPLLDYNRPWQQSQLNRNDFNFNQRYFQSNRQLPLSFQSLPSPTSNMQQRRHNFVRKSRASNSFDGDDDEDWEHFYAHRDRRDLYERIQNISPLNSVFIRSCLLRTMCEVQHFLHPRGYSLLHDMLRVVFTIPIKDDMNDDYSNAMRANDQDCVEFYKDNCPVSLLALFLHTRN